MLIIEVKLKTYLKEYSCLPVADPGEGPGGRGPSPLFLDQTEAQRPEKIIFLRPGPSPYLSVWMSVPSFIRRSGSATLYISILFLCTIPLHDSFLKIQQ